MCRTLPTVFLAITFSLLTSGCLYQVPATHVGDNAAAHESASPFRAYEKVGVPVRAAGGEQPGLSRQIQRLQDARRAYQAEVSFEAAQTRHQQEACRQSAAGMEVPIQSGLKEPATYCQKIIGGPKQKSGNNQ